MMGAEERADGATQAPRLLVLSDCTAVIMAVERARGAGGAWRLYRGHRATILERIMIRWERWLGSGGDLVLQWTPAHSGVFPNHYADVVAKAFLGRDASAPYDRPLARQATLVEYGVVAENGGVSWAAGQS